MKILAIETSTENCSLALWLEGELVVRAVHAEQRHSQVILPMLQTLLAEAELGLAQLDCIAFGAGPGSFTGLRIACGIAQGLAFGANLPVVAVSNLLALAEGANRPNVIAVLDARMGEIYHAVYQKKADQWQELSPPMLCLPQVAPDVAGNNWVGAGSGFLAHSESLAQRYSGRLIETMANAIPHAREIAIIGVSQFLSGQAKAAEHAHPIYIRDKVARTIAERTAKA